MCNASMSSSSCRFFVFNASNWELKVPKMSVLKFYNRFPNSTLVIPLVLAVLEMREGASLVLFPALALLLEYFLHSSLISSKYL